MMTQVKKKKGRGWLSWSFFSNVLCSVNYNLDNHFSAFSHHFWSGWSWRAKMVPQAGRQAGRKWRSICINMAAQLARKRAAGRHHSQRAACNITFYSRCCHTSSVQSKNWDTNWQRKSGILLANRIHLTGVLIKYLHDTLSWDKKSSVSLPLSG